jgi:hypothetical protein
MATPSKKNPKMAEYLEGLYGRSSAINEDKCARCGGPAVSFTDTLSETEYKISGFCQACQDIAFAPPEDDEE